MDRTVLGVDVMIAEVADMALSAKFYGEVLGLVPVVEGPEWTEYVVGGVRLALHPPFVEGRLPQSRPGWTLCLLVTGLASLRRRLEAAGATIHGELHEVPGGVSLAFSDPDGHQLQAVERRPG
jgi:predicted enzyme related to lactoylglutathione lyase